MSIRSLAVCHHSTWVQVRQMQISSLFVITVLLMLAVNEPMVDVSKSRLSYHMCSMNRLIIEF